MPTYDLRALAAPIDLVATLNLLSGQYSVQNIDRSASVWLRESADLPATGELGIRLAPGDIWSFAVDGTPQWVWSFDPEGCALIVNG